MIFSLFIMPASAVDADYTIAENCSVTLVKEDNFKTDDTSVAVSVKLDSPAFIENNRTYTPIRFISENLGADVEWDDEAKRVTITK